jgi:hypothetical protein
MTAVQMQDYVAKMQRTADYDSDYEEEAFPSGYPSRATNVPGLRLGPQLRPEHEPRTAQIEVLPEDEHARDLLEALRRPFPMPTTAPLTAVIHVNVSANSTGGQNHRHELTASELESLYDEDHGLPPLVRDTEGGGRWIDAARPPNLGSG